MMAPSFSLLLVPPRPARLLQPHRPTLRFWCLTPKGRGIEYVSLRGATYLGGVYLLAYLLHLEFYVWYSIMHSSCVYFHALNYIFVIVISTWSWYMTCVLSTLNYLYVISLVLCSFAFASTFYSDANELYLLYSCLFHIFWIHCVGLGHISLSNSSVLIVKSLCDPSMLKTSSLSHTRGSIVINHQKGEIESI